MKLVDEKDQFPENVTLTKRKLLREVAKIYDLIGLAAAFIIRAKIGMHELWQTGVDWDSKIPAATKIKWIDLLKEMKELDNASFQRVLLTAEAAGNPLLCLFLDAS